VELPSVPPSMIELPTDFVTELITAANEQIANFSPLLVLIMGVALALLAVGALIKMAKH